MPIFPFDRQLPRMTPWRRERLRTTLWLVPTVQVVLAVALFGLTFALDRAAYRHDLTLPGWTDHGSADAARQVLTGIAAAVITVVGLVFSITIVALTLASTQFGPRMLRNFVRDRGTQITLGTFVATFVYAVLVLGSIDHGGHGDFVPHLSVTVALGLVLLSLGVLIFFIHHIATLIQLPQVIAGIARDLARAVDTEVEGTATSPDVVELVGRIERDGAVIAATRSGYLQFVAYDGLVAMAADAGAVVRLLYRPGHFVTAGLPLAHVLPASAAPSISHRLDRAHVTGPHRTLTQDLTFAIDQLVEIAIRALSPAVNDTFTALTCIDWLSDGLCKITAAWNPGTVHRDGHAEVRVIAADVRYERFVDRSFDKIRQAGRGMPAVMIRQLDALARVMRYVRNGEQAEALFAQARMILESSEESVPAAPDRADVRARYELVAELATTRR